MNKIKKNSSKKTFVRVNKIQMSKSLLKKKNVCCQRKKYTQKDTLYTDTGFPARKLI